MESSNLIRWGGLAAVVAGALFLIINLTTVLILGLGQGQLELLVRTVLSPVAGALLLLGLVGLYARQLEVVDIVGLIGFLLAFFGTVLALAGNVWASMLGYLGWALFGVSSWQARIYPPTAAILLVVGAVLTAPFSAFVVNRLGDIFVYAGIAASTIFGIAIAWLGFVLFTGRGEEARRAA